MFTKIKRILNGIKRPFRKIEIKNPEHKAVELAKESHKEFEFLTVSNDYKTRKHYGVDQKGMAEMVNQILGDFIEVRVEHMILEDIIMEHGSTKMLKAYDEYQEKSGKAIRVYFEQLAGVKSGIEKPVLQ